MLLQYCAPRCLFVETSAKTNVAVDQAFDELLNKVNLAIALACAQGVSPLLGTGQCKREKKELL